MAVFIAMLLLCANSLAQTLELEGSLLVSNGNADGGVVVANITAPDGSRSGVTSYPNLDGSWLQSPAARGKDKHQFTLDNNGETVRCVASLKNASVGFLCEGGRVLGDVPYPSGCRSVYFQSLWHVLYVGFEAGCSPLKIELTGDGVQPFRATQEYPEELAGKKVLVSRGEDVSFSNTIFYSYIVDGGTHLVHKSADNGMEFRIPSSEISSTLPSNCINLTDLLHLPNRTMDGTIDVVVDCADSAGASHRYLVRAYFDYSVHQVLPISEARGNFSASQDGRFLAVLVSGDNSIHSIVLYDTSRIQSPIPVNYEGPIPHIKFLQAEDGHNYLAILREGNDMELVDLEHLFTHGSSALEESRVQFPMTMVHSCTPTCPYLEIVSGNLMIAVWNRGSLQYDLRATQLSTRDAATIPSGSSTSPVFAFVRLRPVPVVTPSLTSSSTVSAPTTTPAVQPTPTELPSSTVPPTTSSSSSITVYPSPSTSPPSGRQRLRLHDIVGIVVGLVLLAMLMLFFLPFIIILVWLWWRKRTGVIKPPIEVSIPQGVEESGMIPPVQEEDSSSISSSSIAPVQESENSSLNSTTSTTSNLS